MRRAHGRLPAGRGPGRLLRRLLRTNLFEGCGTWLYERFGAQVVADHHRQLGQDLAGMLPAGARLLDVGCGPGDLLIQLARRRPDLRLVGIDSARAAIRRCRARARSAGGDLRFVHGGAEALPFASASFDAAVSTASFKHWSSQRSGLSEIRRVLAPGSPFLLSELDPLADPRRLGAHAGHHARIAAAVVGHLVLPASIGREQARLLAVRGGFAVEGDEALPDSPLYALALRVPPDA